MDIKNCLKNIADNLDTLGFISEASSVDNVLSNYEKKETVKKMVLEILEKLDLFSEKGFDINKKNIIGLCPDKLKEIIKKALENFGKYKLLSKIEEFNKDELKNAINEFLEEFLKNKKGGKAKCL